MPPGSSNPSRSASMLGLERDVRIQIHFRLPYSTKWGQELMLIGAGALLGNWNPKRGQHMRCSHEKEGLVWEAVVLLPWQPVYRYKYALVHQDGGVVHVDKWASEELTLQLPEGLQSGDVVDVMDTSSDRSHPVSILASAAFCKVIRAGKVAMSDTVVRKEPALGEAIVRFVAMDHLLADGEALCVSGGLPVLGNWQTDQMMRLTEVRTPSWEVEIRLPYSAFPFSYKYAISSPDGAILEVGEPRVVALPPPGHGGGAPSVIVRHDGHFRREKHWRGAGVAIPVFSCRTHQSLGVGEFLDLLQLVDLTDQWGLRLIQLLPVNDTSVYNMWWDSYPYSSLSVHALHPQYIAVRALRSQMPDDLAALIEQARIRLDGGQVDYEATMTTKLSLARRVFDRYGQETLATKEYQEWYHANADWLRPYAAFCFLRDLFQTAEHWRWGALSSPNSSLIDRLTSPSAEGYTKIQFLCYLQYHLHLQLLQVSTYAASKRIILKGDLPIGVDKRSVDTWVDPGLFRMDQSTGAPPDDFSELGQNWGFPTYNWEAMSRDNYAWWQRRLKHMAQYFSAYRIDHVLGFFRIWEIPANCSTGLLGHFRPSIPITKHELEAKGLWDVERLVEPFIRPALLTQLFGDQAEEVAAKYLLESAPGVYRFRPQYVNEAQLSDIKTREDAPPWLKEEVATVRRGLMKLRQNVVLLRDVQEPDKLYPRFALYTTSSYADLDPKQRAALRDLHDDYFFRRHDALWRQSAMEKLPVLMAATDMLVCGEDLGFVPDCVPPIMQELGLIGLRIQRMSVEPGKEFNNPALYPYLTVASPSCHDVTPTRAWYEADPERAERFFYHMLGSGGSPPTACTPEIMRVIVAQHLNCPSVWAIFPIQDLMALSANYTDRPANEEVINDPTNAKHYWRFRLHVHLEDLIADEGLAELMRELVLCGERASIKDMPPVLPSS